MLLIPAILRKVALLSLLPAFAAIQSQEVKPLEWRTEQQPTSTPCTPNDLAFASAPEQVALAQSYSSPYHPGMKCESVHAPSFHEARVLRIWQPSVLDDGYGYTLIQPKGATTVRLIATGGGLTPYRGHESDQSNLAAMNAMLQTSGAEYSKDADWLAISLAYLTLLSEEPTLVDTHHLPGPGENFKSYTVSGLLAELPKLKRKHLLPTAECDRYTCQVRFFYRTEPVEPLESATFQYTLLDGKLALRSVRVDDYVPRGHKKQVLGR
jgi:hypothetical protein